ncbi:alpha/beta-hydrolase [Aureobasidium subglaciale]|nr:alpha/beta-hydrolase [Aureobasidium subglaciale]
MKSRLTSLFVRDVRQNGYSRQVVNVRPSRGLYTTTLAQFRRPKLFPRDNVLSHQIRTIFAGVSPFILVPGIFVGLLIGVSWTEQKIESLDGTKLSVAVARPEHSSVATPTKRKRVVVLYFQGNGASIPPRTPMLSNILRAAANDSPHEWILLALSYRGYWSSSGRAHQRGIEKDAQAFVNWAVRSYGQNPENTELILWGQSIGSGVAAYAASKYLGSSNDPGTIPISRLVLETPFISIRSMLAAIYPDWWVPYKHLWPFLRSWWDSEEALRRIADTPHPPKVLMVVASGDEIVPRVQADQLEHLCKDLSLDVTRKDVLGALHTQASTLEQGKRVISTWMRGEKV